MEKVGEPVNVVSIVFFVLGSLVFLLTYVRSAINKSNRDIDRNTIGSLKDNNDALSEEREMWRTRALDAEGQNKVLQNTITAAPAIAQLTELVAKQHAENTRWQQENTKLQTKMLKSFESFVEAHDTEAPKPRKHRRQAS